jgi:hypothetical protein
MANLEAHYQMHQNEMATIKLEVDGAISSLQHDLIEGQAKYGSG